MSWRRFADTIGDILAFQFIPHSLSWTSQCLISRHEYDWYYQRVSRPLWDVFGRRVNGVFAVLHTMVGVSSYLVYSQEPGDLMRHSMPLMLCGLQVLLDAGWRPIHFNQKSWDRSLRHCVLCTVLSGFICSRYMDINRVAGYLFLPYSCWWFYLTTVAWYVRLVNEPVEPWYRLSFGGTPLMRRPTVPGENIRD